VAVNIMFLTTTESLSSKPFDHLYEKLNHKLSSLMLYSGQRGRKKHIQKDAQEKEKRAVNLTNITFTKEQIKTLEMGPQYAIEKSPKYYISELIIGTENAIKNLQSSIQNTFDT
jgi:hypothetical protein